MPSHNSYLFYQVAKEKHKKKIKNLKGNWFEVLNDSDSEREEIEEEFDGITNELKIMNLSPEYNKYYETARRGNFSINSQTKNFQGISKYDKNNLKTKNLRNQIAYVMKKTPDKSKILNVDFF